MTILDRWRQNEGRVRQAGKLALEQARAAGVPAYYRDPGIGAGIIRQMPDGSRSVVSVAANELVTGDKAKRG
ncbi:hypothetical protein FHR90_003403 [Endobacter medicaginis]|uniref:Uncharacterized protein n=1 Tax=Endobacter medicaginis TaxID=1181271 RepID=A0A839V074_9PROT|nr:hypothetical protein [Endobacter medicaginis]MBB3175547.1 hypothetical protein [Endobacter medicaginis]MCX5476581.1 hypothetical protein [Endobacter medicaginis]NVN29037.1 hypothetical protein [Endobacter medicaginis]